VIGLRTSAASFAFDEATGRLVSLRTSLAPDQEFVADVAGLPVLAVQYLVEGRFREATSRDARVTVRERDGGGGVEIALEGIGGREIDALVSVSGTGRDEACRWTLTLENRSGLRITSVQFPFIVLRYRLDGAPGTEELLRAWGPGALYRAPRPQHFAPDTPRAWRMVPENMDCTHYPGYTVAQLLAYGNDRAGFVAWCDDDAGRVKIIQPLHHEPPLDPERPVPRSGLDDTPGGIRLGFAHVGDWPADGRRTLEYGVRVAPYRGDWRAAAEVYRSWSLGQPWARTPLAARTDVPSWLLDSPPHVIVRLQGVLDFGPADPVAEFLPYEKTVPLLERVADRVGSPIVAVLMAWERGGPWVYPDCFPPVGGFDSMAALCRAARERGWHVGTFANGTRWVTAHSWSGYDGAAYLAANDGMAGVCRTAEGGPWEESWDRTWRPSFACCLGAEATRAIARDFVRTLVDTGLDWIQFLDQNIGCSTFPCFADGHVHPAAPGAWMTGAMRGLLGDFAAVAAAKRGEGRQLAFSAECPVNEVFLQQLQVCDVRVIPPGHETGWFGGVATWVPLYHYLYHEFILLQGGFGNAPEPYHLPIRTAYNLVVGEIPGAVLQGDGTLLARDTENWAPWGGGAGSDDDAIALLAAATALRRGPGRPYLVLGRMLATSRVDGVETVRWQHGGRDHAVAAVFHEAWRAPDGRVGVALANWTTSARSVTVVDGRLAGPCTVHVAAGGSIARAETAADAKVVELPPLSAALIENGEGGPSWRSS
jgi:hypothetical protein